MIFKLPQSKDRQKKLHPTKTASSKYSGSCMDAAKRHGCWFTSMSSELHTRLEEAGAEGGAEHAALPEALAQLCNLTRSASPVVATLATARVIADIATVSYHEGYHSSHPALKKSKM
jgi:hypothetical protein